MEFILQELESSTHTYVRCHEAFLHRKENLEAGRLTENIFNLPPRILHSIGLLDSGKDRRTLIQAWPCNGTRRMRTLYPFGLIVADLQDSVAARRANRVALSYCRSLASSGGARLACSCPPAAGSGKGHANRRNGSIALPLVLYGYRPRICRRGLISRSTGHRCMAGLYGLAARFWPQLCRDSGTSTTHGHSFLTSIERVYPTDEWDRFNLAIVKVVNYLCN